MTYCGIHSPGLLLLDYTVLPCPRHLRLSHDRGHMDLGVPLVPLVKQVLGHLTSRTTYNTNMNTLPLASDMAHYPPICFSRDQIISNRIIQANGRSVSATVYSKSVPVGQHGGLGDKGALRAHLSPGNHFTPLPLARFRGGQVVEQGQESQRDRQSDEQTKGGFGIVGGAYSPSCTGGAVFYVCSQLIVPECAGSYLLYLY